ncbi:diguanylate cyclase [candidate division KSB1 bacterium]|nr:diguanylate cyclase [candidate division KSB1 bacterium]
MSRILIVDDEPNWHNTYRRIFRAKPYETEYASSGAEALEKAATFKPDIILLDIMMPGIDGYTVCEDLKQKEDTKDVEVIFVSGKGKLDDRLKAYKLRASDFLVKPFSHDELLAKLELLLEKRKFYLEMASTDALTQLGNRKFFDEKYGNIFDLSVRYEKHFAIAIADIDHFKRVNDTYGHDMGDFILQQVAQRLLTSFRKTDLVARIGGEEFAFLLPETKREFVAMVLNRCRADIESQVFRKPGSDTDLKVTISIGFATFPEDADDQKRLFKTADECLYTAKNNGRNRVFPEK